MLAMGAGPLAVMINDVVSALRIPEPGTPSGCERRLLGARDLRAHHGALLRVIAAMGEVDAAISTASFRTGRHDWTRPRFRQAGAPAELTGVRHPLLLDAVPNSIRLAPGRGVLITGSNMSGKSTFLRTLGVTAVLAQTLNTCLAAEYSAPVFNVRSCIGRSDDLLSGKSYYIAEVESLLGLVEASAELRAAFVSSGRTVSRHECCGAHRRRASGAPGTGVRFESDKSPRGDCGNTRW